METLSFIANAYLLQTEVVQESKWPQPRGWAHDLFRLSLVLSDICSPCGFHPPALLVNAEHLLFLC